MQLKRNSTTDPAQAGRINTDWNRVLLLGFRAHPTVGIVRLRLGLYSLRIRVHARPAVVLPLKRSGKGVSAVP